MKIATSIMLFAALAFTGCEKTDTATPDGAGAPETPATPETPEAPETPETPETPEAAAPEGEAAPPA